MKVFIVAKTGKGKKSKYRDLKKTQKFAFSIAKKIHGKVIYGRGFIDGTGLVLQK